MTRAGRSTTEWKGKTPDSVPPDYVKLRVFQKHGGICHVSGRKITPADKWDADHVIALCNGGENRESNLKPALKDKHLEKTKADVAERAETDAMSKRHIGLRGKSTFPKRGSYKPNTKYINEDAKT